MTGGSPSQLYRDSLALLTDLYQLTMAYGYWKAGVAAREACFQLVFRQHPFGELDPILMRAWLQMP